MAALTFYKSPDSMPKNLFTEGFQPIDGFTKLCNEPVKSAGPPTNRPVSEQRNKIASKVLDRNFSTEVKDPFYNSSEDNPMVLGHDILF